MKRALIYTLLGCLCAISYAQTPLERSDLSAPSLIAPKYFGPNAFPVPDLPSIPGSTSLELAGDWYSGSLVSGASDNTCDIFARATFPLFSDRVNLTLWMPAVMEFYTFDESVAQARRLKADAPRAGRRVGDVYVSTDILLLKEGTAHLDLVLRAAVKTASGGDFESARYYDAAGYFFDVTAYKRFSLSANADLRLGVSTGFLCWQTNNARQNDAVQYGAMASLLTKYVDISACLGGYAGWEGDGDSPLTIKCAFYAKTGRFVKPFVYLQDGLVDYPFFQLRAGLIYSIH